MSPNRRAVYPGTFDPITRGHEDLVRRAAGIFDHVLLAIAANPGTKAPMFNIDERIELAREVLADISNVQVVGYSGLTVEFARAQGIGVIVRGLRAVSDFEFEFQLANMGRHIAPGVETVYLTPQEQLRSSLPRWCARSPRWAGAWLNSCIRWSRRRSGAR